MKKQNLLSNNGQELAVASRGFDNDAVRAARDLFDGSSTGSVPFCFTNSAGACQEAAAAAAADIKDAQTQPDSALANAGALRAPHSPNPCGMMANVAVKLQSITGPIQIFKSHDARGGSTVPNATALRCTALHPRWKSTQLERGLSRHFRKRESESATGPLNDRHSAGSAPSAQVFTRRLHPGARSGSSVINRRAQSAEDSESAPDGVGCSSNKSLLLYRLIPNAAPVPFIAASHGAPQNVTPELRGALNCPEVVAVEDDGGGGERKKKSFSQLPEEEKKEALRK